MVLMVMVVVKVIVIIFIVAMTIDHYDLYGPQLGVQDGPLVCGEFEKSE